MKKVAKRFVPGIALILGGLLAAAPTVAYAQERATDVGSEVVAPMQPTTLQPEENWGLTATSHFTIPSFAFTSLDDSPQTRSNYNRFSPTGQEVEAAVQLPSGARVTSVELQGCDTNAAATVVWILFRVNSDGTFVTLSPLGSTGATPGCGFFVQPLTTPVTIDNRNTYYVAVRSGTTATTTYTAVRVFYNLQVSPAPGTATFADVPTTSGQFRFVEALAAAGITGGCGGSPPNYCPNDPVTRGQMAVFIAAALGLHFAP